MIVEWFRKYDKTRREGVDTRLMTAVYRGGDDNSYCSIAIETENLSFLQVYAIYRPKFSSRIRNVSTTFFFTNAEC